MQSVAPVAAKAARLSPSGMAEARTAVRVTTTDWAMSGRVSSPPRAAAAAANAGTPGVIVQPMPKRVEPADLLGDGAVEGRVAGVDPRHVLPGRMRGLDLGDDLGQVHGRRVDHSGARRRLGHDLGRHQRARIEADLAGLDQAQPAHRDQVGRARPRADEMNRHPTS